MSKSACGCMWNTKKRNMQNEGESAPESTEAGL